MRDKSKPPVIEAGVYKSHKNKLYRVTGEVNLNASNRASDCEWMVEYYDEPIKYVGDIALKHSREYGEFVESVPKSDGSGEIVPRFQKVEE